MDNAEFAYLRALVLKRSAIVLNTGKEYLVEARLEPVARAQGLDGISGLVKRLKASPEGPLHEEVVEAMTTNETSFFRDVHPFEILRKDVIPALMERREMEKKLSIWCAASSSGQEPYSIAMILRADFPKLADWTISFIASDISQRMLERSQKGVYSQLEVNRGLPVQMLMKFFKQDNRCWVLNDEIRKMVSFQQINLASSWPPMPQVDLLFMRNVLIYFDTETKKEIFRKVRGVLRNDGYLFLGGAETTVHLDENFERASYKNGGCYCLR
ncbi:MAG: CheR family methyltransferase [Dehalococcoidia bacterium]